jgi:hypothetical protein
MDMEKILKANEEKRKEAERKRIRLAQEAANKFKNKK